MIVRKMLLNKSLFLIILLIPLMHFNGFAKGETVRKERIMINKGNDYYNNKQYKLAAKCYNEALKANPSSDVAKYNLGLTDLKLSADKNDTTAVNRKLRQDGIEAMKQISSLASTKPMLASKAEYNLGNIAFESENYGEAIQKYKQALRLNPNDDAARRNLRITQLKQQQKQNNQNNQKNQQDKDQQDKQNQQDQKDKQQDKQQDQQQNNSPKNNEIDKQTAEQILKAVENKENQTRARMNASGSGEKSRGQNTYQKNW